MPRRKILSVLTAALLMSSLVTSVSADVTEQAPVSQAEDMSDEEILEQTRIISEKVSGSADGCHGTELTPEEFEILERAIALANEDAGEGPLDTQTALFMSSSNSVHGFYYDFLSDDQKTMYDALGDACAQYMSDNTSSVTSQGFFNIVSVDAAMTSDELLQTYWAFFYSNPEYFYLASQVGYSNGSNPSQIGLMSNTPCRDPDDRHDLRDRIDAVAEEWLAQIDAGTTAAEKELNIAKVIAENVDYRAMSDDGIVDKSGNPLTYQSILTPMIYGQSVCTGYAMTVNYFCRKLGLDSILVTSHRSAATAHAWNRIKLDGVWYEYDATWYDTTGTDPDWLNRSTASFEELDGNGMHTVNEDFVLYSGVTLPECSYDYGEAPGGTGGDPGDDPPVGPTDPDDPPDGPAESSGSCGDDMEWSYSEGTLTLTGTGAMYDFDEAPWTGSADEIKEIVFNGQCSRIGNNAFCSLSLLYFDIPEGCTVGENAFAGTSVSTLYIPESAVLSDTAFQDAVISHIHLYSGAEVSAFAGKYGLPANENIFHVLDRFGGCDDPNCEYNKITLAHTAVSFTVKGVFGGRNVTFSSDHKDALIYYTQANTSTLTENDPHVRAGDTVLFEDYYGTVYARTYIDGIWGVPCRLILKIPKVNTPVISQNRNICTITTTTPDCFIIYTTDGTEPSLTNGIWSSRKVSVDVTEVTILRAIAVRSCFTNSDCTQMRFDTLFYPPSFSVTNAFGGRDVTFKNYYSDADIYYSTSSSDIGLSCSSVKAGGTVRFNDYCTVYAKAYYKGRWSAVSRLILKIPTVNKPTVSQEGTYLVIGSSTPESYIIYTTDETAPSMTNGTRVKGKAMIPGSVGMKIRAVGVRSGFADSEELRIRLTGS
ncbi:MAG: chitobiase/beta-hexosaminidase C-terminal domain-containing protein [Oscillospiraceae bacterium]|nr:chitobiase/beta-hexosaminidase C-terminal domain-containing protein [Oscillospiraceae bacterium]